MSDHVVSAVISVLMEKLISGALMKFAEYEEINSLLNIWKNKLTLIQDVLVDAGQKHITQRAVKSWLHDLQELAYDIDDVLDDMATQGLKHELNQEPDVSTSRVSKFLKRFKGPFTHFTPYNMMYGHKMRSKLDEINNRLEDLFICKNNLGLDVNVKLERPNRTYRRSQQTSLVDESKVLGREVDRIELLGKLLEHEACDQNFSVVSIVGLGGIGKTTLAKVLYNDKKVKDKFKLRAWVCVSEEFDVFNISKAIYQAVVGEDRAFANLDLLHVALQEKLSKQKFLIVLDDVWNEEDTEWELLQNPFIVGAPGSKVIVTTRKTKVALVMNSLPHHSLDVLSDEIALSLLAQYALDEQNFDNHPSLRSIAQGIIKKCDGLPLALVTLGRVLKTKRSDDEWEELLNSQIWNLEDESGILPALRLSYYDLPPHLKQVFAYCSLFPKDYLFAKKELVLLWVAEGFLPTPKGNKSMETLGRQYFGELQSRSFFQESTNDKSLYIMHDLMNDLAISVAGDFFFMLDDKMDVNGRNEAFEKFRHVSFLGHRHGSHRKLKDLHRATRLRTFLPMSVNREVFNSFENVLVELLPHLQFLRVLSLNNYSITEVPQSIGKFVHLRYLNFSRTDIKQVPEQVSELYNLQSLLVSRCYELSHLPVSLAKLINLRHLDIRDTPLLNKTPLGIGGLMSLQTLPKVYIEEDNGFKICELKDLVDLQGGLSINGLDKVRDPVQAKDANLQQKKGLDNLNMIWSDVFIDSRNSMIESEVLERLIPHRKLKELMISFYGGIEFPSWVGDPSFDQLTELRLEGCRRCTHLPTFRHLKSLRKLLVKRMDGVTIWSLLGIAFPSLEILEIDDMEGLQVWSTNVGEGIDGTFTRLREIKIKQCPKLDEVSIGLIPSLEVLTIKRCSEAVLRAMVGVSSSIRTLKMKDIRGLTNKLDGELLKHLREVEYLCIIKCDGLKHLWDSESEAYRYLVSLKNLHVDRCKKLVSMVEKEVNVNVGSSSSMGSVLKTITLLDCETLESYSCPNSIEGLVIIRCTSLTSSNLKSFSCGLWSPNLKDLRIGCLKKPMSEWGLQNYPTTLVSLMLFGENSGVESFAMEEDASTTSSTSFLLPPSLTFLSIHDFKDVNSLSEVLQRLTRLERLYIHSCPNLRDVPQTTTSLKVYVYESFRPVRCTQFV